MKFLPLLALVVLTTSPLFAQQKSLESYIPKDQFFMGSNIATTQIDKKIGDGEIHAQNLITDMLVQAFADHADEEKNAQLKEELKTPSQLGFDIPEKVSLWIQLDKAKENKNKFYAPTFEPNIDLERAVMSYILPINDSKKFRSFLDKTFGKEATKKMVSTGDAMNLIHGKHLINWNKNRVIISSSMNDNFFKWDDEESYQEWLDEVLLGHAQIFNEVNPKNAITSDPNYLSHLEKNSDFDFWLDYGPLFKDLNDQTPAELAELMESIMDLLYGFKLGGNGYFKKGEVYVSTKMYDYELMNKSLSSNILQLNKEFFKHIDASNLMALYSTHIGFKDFFTAYADEFYKALRKSKQGTIAADFMEVLDIFIDEDEIYTLMKGDMIFALTDVRVIEKESVDFEYDEDSDTWQERPSTSKEIMPIGSFMFSYTNETYIKTFIDLGSNSGVLSKRAEGVWAIGGIKEELGCDVFIIMKNGMLLFTNDENVPNNIDKGFPKEKLMSAEDIKGLSSCTYQAFVNVKQSFDIVQKAFQEMEQPFEENLGGFENSIKKIEFKSFPPKDNTIVTDFRIELTDKNANTLKVIMDGMKNISEASQHSNKVEIEEKIDSEDGTKKL